MIFNNKSIPNACQTVKIGAELQNKGANQFHNNETIHPDNAQHAIITMTPTINNITDFMSNKY